MVRPEIIAGILVGYALPRDGIHGIPHWARVLDTGRRLAPHTGADVRVIALFAVFHDARRENEDADPEHGRRGADLAASMRGLLDLDTTQFDLLIHACVHHADGTLDEDPTIGTCWDADRLDLWRVGLTPRGRYLCTPAARTHEMLEWSRSRSLADHLPEFAAAWLDA